MYCRQCGAAKPDQAAFCIKCGTPSLSGAGFCQNCGAATDPNAVVCVSCGAALRPMGPAGAGCQPYAYYRKEGAGPLAITGFVLSLLGLITCVTAVPGFIIGLLELKKIGRGESPQAGRGFALTAAIVGGILTAAWVLFIIVYVVIIIIAIATS